MFIWFVIRLYLNVLAGVALLALIVALVVVCVGVWRGVVH